jgi:chromosome segregation ATPase
MSSHPPSAAEAIATLVKEIDRLRTENATLRAEVSELRNCAVLSDKESDRLNGLNARLRDELVGMEEQRNALRAQNERLSAEGQRVLDKMNAYKADCETLRELVREAYEEADLGWLGTNWDERAEKVLGD